MTERPTLYLTNYSSLAQHGPGRKLCAMAAPRHHELGQGKVAEAAPDLTDLHAVRAGLMSIEDYRAACTVRFAFFVSLGRYRPDTLACVTRAHLEQDVRPHNRPVEDGDTLFCACARPDSPRRTHPCHLEWLAPVLVRAGWDVVLYGRRLTMQRFFREATEEEEVTLIWRLEPSPHFVQEDLVVWVDNHTPYTGSWEAPPAFHGQLFGGRHG